MTLRWSFGFGVEGPQICEARRSDRGAEGAAKELGLRLVESSVLEDTEPIYSFVFDAHGPTRP